MRFVYFENVNKALLFIADMSNVSNVYELIFNQTYEIKEN